LNSEILSEVKSGCTYSYRDGHSVAVKWWKCNCRLSYPA